MRISLIFHVLYCADGSHAHSSFPGPFGLLLWNNLFLLWFTRIYFSLILLDIFTLLIQAIYENFNKKYRTLYLLFCFIWENCAIACRAEHTSSVISWQTKPTPTSGQLLTCIGLHAQFYSKKLVEVRWLIQNLGHDWSLGGWTDSTTEAALSCHGDTPDTWYPAVALPVVSQKLPQISGSWTLTINGSFSDTFGQYVIS